MWNMYSRVLISSNFRSLVSLTVAWIKFEQVKYLVLKLFKKSNNQKGKPLFFFFFFFFFFLGGGVEHNKVVIQCLRLLSDCFCLEFFFIHAISFCLELKRSGHGKGSSNNYLLKRWWLVVDIYWTRQENILCYTNATVNSCFSMY